MKIINYTIAGHPCAMPFNEANIAIAESEADVGTISIVDDGKEAPPAPLTFDERLTALENAAPAPAEYVAGAWYYRGDKVLFNDEVYTCISPVGVVCVWSPVEYPTYWSRN